MRLLAFTIPSTARACQKKGCRDGRGHGAKRACASSQCHDAVLQTTARRVYVHRLASAAMEECRTQRRGVRDTAAGRIGFVGAEDLVFTLFPPDFNHHDRAYLYRVCRRGDGGNQLRAVETVLEGRDPP